MKELAKEFYFIVLMSGIRVKISEENYKELQNVLSNPNCPKFIKIEDGFVNVATISGIHNSGIVEELFHKENNDWKCKYKNWHEKNITCDCAMYI